VLPDMSQILQVEEWRHPNVVDGHRPSESDTFRHFANILVTGDAGLYRSARQPNAHWSNWPVAANCSFARRQRDAHSAAPAMIASLLAK
jgi:hypothetical protein